MNFWQLVRYIKADGCNLRLYNKEELKLAQCPGTFDISKNNNPIISLTIKGHSQVELMQLLLHEYAHFLQWKSGFLHKLEGENLKLGWDVLEKWLQKTKKYTEEELKWARDAVVLIEYDADLRVLELSKQLGIDIGSHKDYMASSYSYITLLKWAAKHRKWDGPPDGSFFSGKLRTPQEILAEITPEEEQILNEFLGEE